MPIKDMPAFVKKHKEVRHTIYCCIASCIFLILQLILMNKNPLNIMFDVLIPIMAAFTFGCYAITMAYDRPVILTCPPTVYFVSLLVNQLIGIEVGVEDTYPYIVFIEIIPYIFFCIAVSTDKLKKVTSKILKVSCFLMIIASITVFVLSAFFRISVFHTPATYMKSTFGMICSFMAIMFIYIGMDILLIISGTDKRVRIPRKQKAQNITTEQH